MQSLQEISLATDSQTDSRPFLIRRWIVIYADAYRDRDGMPRNVSDGRLGKIYETALGDIPTAQLAQALARTLQVCKFFPTPADIREQIDRAGTGAFALEAEQQWHRLLAWVRRFYHPDLGVTRGAPALNPTVEFAARAAGGFHWLETCPESDLQWAKKRFVESFSRVHETGEVEHLLGDGEAKRILKKLRMGSRKPVRAELARAQEPSPDRPSKSEVRAVLDRIVSSPNPNAATMSDEAFESRKREQKRRLEEWEAARQKASASEQVVRD